MCLRRHAGLACTERSRARAGSCTQASTRGAAHTPVDDGAFEAAQLLHHGLRRQCDKQHEVERERDDDAEQHAEEQRGDECGGHHQQVALVGAPQPSSHVDVDQIHHRHHDDGAEHGRRQEEEGGRDKQQQQHDDEGGDGLRQLRPRARRVVHPRPAERPHDEKGLEDGPHHVRCTQSQQLL